MALTGRFYKCLSLKGEESKQCSAWFEIGKVYQECDTDVLGENECDEYSLLLHSDVETPILDKKGDIIMFSPMFYVSAMDFELLKHVVPISLN